MRASPVAGWRSTWPLLLALALLVAAHALATRKALRSQLEEGNREAAAALASSLARQGGSVASWQAVAAAHFAAGRTRLLRLQAPGGQVPLEMQAPPRAMAAPDWFVAWLPVDADPGQASVSPAGGVVQVSADTAAAQDALWLSFVEASAAALLGWLMATAAAHWWRQRGAREAPPPAEPMPTRSVFDAQALQDAQAEQVAALQRQAQTDAVTGLPLRRHFLAQLQQRLAEPGGPGLALLLVRVLHLEALNLRLGHDATDQWLGAVADVLMTYVERVPGTFAGRLNGTDFALCLPVPGVALETAQSLRTALAAAPALRTGSAEIAVGGVDALQDTSASLALAAADAALARAEDGADSGTALVVEAHVPSAESAVGERAWREQIGAALAEGRTALAASPLRDRSGHEMHLDCALQVQLSPAAPYQGAERWLALARRSRLMPQVDLASVELALAAIAADGRPRAVRVSPVSLSATGFIADLASRLAEAPLAARLLFVECGDGLQPGSAGSSALGAAVAAWRPLGTRVGVEYAGSAAPHLPSLKKAGVEYVKVDARHLQGVASEAAVQGFAQSLVALAHGLKLRLLAAGVADAADLDALWALGFDGAGGPAVEAAAAVPSA